MKDIKIRKKGEGGTFDSDLEDVKLVEKLRGFEKNRNKKWDS
jgi:hypothetical protein